jgi:hypothetical protein
VPPKDIGKILARVLAAGEVQRNLARAGRHNPAGEYTRALVRGLAHQAQHAHAGVVVMQHLTLRRLADQLIARRFDHLGDFDALKWPTSMLRNGLPRTTKQSNAPSTEIGAFLKAGWRTSGA